MGNCVRCSLETCSHLLDSVIRSPKVAQNRAVSSTAVLLPDSPRWAWRMAARSQPARGGFWTGLRPFFRP